MSQVTVKMEELSPVKKKLSLEIPWSEVKNEHLFCVILGNPRPLGAGDCVKAYSACFIKYCKVSHSRKSSRISRHVSKLRPVTRALAPSNQSKK